MMLNYKVVMVSDGNAAENDEEHNATLRSIYLTFGDVMDTDMLVDILKRRSNIRTGGGNRPRAGQQSDGRYAPDPQSRQE